MRSIPCGPKRSGRRVRTWSANALLEAAVDQHAEGDGAVAHLVLPGGIHLAEGDGISVRHEDRVVAEAAAAARRIGQGAEHLAFENIAMIVGPGQCERRNEMR